MGSLVVVPDGGEGREQKWNKAAVANPASRSRIELFAAGSADSGILYQAKYLSALLAH